MKNCLRAMWEKMPKPDSFSLSWPPALNFPFLKVDKDKKQNNVQHFEEMIEKSSWRKEFINHKEIWICEQDNTFQIECGEYAGAWQEKWAKVYPDVNASEYPVYLKINNIIIKQFTFISCDGGRIFVPLPELFSAGCQTGYVWRRNSLPYKVCRIVGKYYIYETIEGVAQMSKIKII